MERSPWSQAPPRMPAWRHQIAGSQCGYHATSRILKHMKCGTQIGCGWVCGSFSCMTQAYHTTKHWTMMFGQWKGGKGCALASTPLPTNNVIMSIRSVDWQMFFLTQERSPLWIWMVPDMCLCLKCRPPRNVKKLWSVSLSKLVQLTCPNIKVQKMKVWSLEESRTMQGHKTNNLSIHFRSG